MSIFKSRKDRLPPPVKVAYAADQAEAEMIQGILREEGIPSVTSKPKDTFLTDLFAMGPRNIMVPASAEAKARQLLAEYRQDPEEDETLPGT